MNLPKARIIDEPLGHERRVSCCFCGGIHHHGIGGDGVGAGTTRTSHCQYPEHGAYELVLAPGRPFKTDREFAVPVKDALGRKWARKSVSRLVGIVGATIRNHPEPDRLRGMTPKAFAQWFMSEDAFFAKMFVGGDRFGFDTFGQIAFALGYPLGDWKVRFRQKRAICPEAAEVL